MKYKFLVLCVLFLAPEGLVSSDTFLHTKTERAPSSCLSRSPSSEGSLVGDDLGYALELFNQAVDAAAASREKRKSKDKNLRDSHREIKKKLGELQAAYDALEGDHDVLLTEHEELQVTFAQLKKDFDALVSAKSVEQRGMKREREGAHDSGAGRSPEGSKTLSPLALSTSAYSLPTDSMNSSTSGVTGTPRIKLNNTQFEAFFGDFARRLGLPDHEASPSE